MSQPDPDRASDAACDPASDPGARRRPLRKVYVRHGPEVWVRARALYLGGRTAGQVAAELGCSIAAVRAQASRGGWTRRDAAASVGAAETAPLAPVPLGSVPLGPVPLGEGRFDPSPSAGAGGGPAHLRLTREAWEVIRGERLAGGSIAALAARWDVAEGTIRRHARDEGWSNTDRGEAVSRAMVEAKLVERAFADGRAAAEREGAERAEAEAASRDARGDAKGDADGAEAEADPLEAARTLLRRAAAAAVAGRLAQAGAAVKLADGLARAAAALGLGQDGDDGWDDDAPEPVLTLEQLEALRDDVQRRYARFDRPEAGESASTEPAPPPAPGPAAAAEAAPVFAAPLSGAPPAEAPPEPARSGIGSPPRPIAAPPWPAWAGPPDGWAGSARRG